MDMTWRTTTGFVVLLAMINSNLAITVFPYDDMFGAVTNNFRPPELQDASGEKCYDLTDGAFNSPGIKFLDQLYTTICVTTNGLVTFGSTIGASMVRPDSGVGVGDASLGPYIAVFWEDAEDPSNTSPTGEVGVLIATATSDPGGNTALLSEAFPGTITSLMKLYFTNIAQHYGTTTTVIQITWKDIFAEGDTSEDKNTYQLLILTDDCQTYAFFNYVNIEWWADRADSGNKARAAISAGDGITWLELPNSGKATIFQLATASNLNDPLRSQGWFGVRVDRAAVMELCPAACEGLSYGTCGTFGCECTGGLVSNSIDCTNSVYNDMSWEIPRTACATPCGGCSSWVVDTFTDDCAAPTSATEDCNKVKCTKGVQSTTEVVRKNGRLIQRNRKCCYKFGSSDPVKLSTSRFPDGKSCCRPRVKGWTGAAPLPSC